MSFFLSECDAVYAVSGCFEAVDFFPCGGVNDVNELRWWRCDVDVSVFPFETMVTRRLSGAAHGVVEVFTGGVDAGAGRWELVRWLRRSLGLRRRCRRSMWMRSIRCHRHRG